MVEIHFLFCYLEREEGTINGFFLWSLCCDWYVKKVFGLDFLINIAVSFDRYSKKKVAFICDRAIFGKLI